jgi:hypothetical protein
MTDILKSSVHRVLHLQLCLHSHFISLTLEITPRMNFAHWFITNQNLLDDSLWSGEEHFSLDGVVKRHNYVIWALKNPHAFMSQSVPSTRVCFGWLFHRATNSNTSFPFRHSLMQHTPVCCMAILFSNCDEMV